MSKAHEEHVETNANAESNKKEKVSDEVPAESSAASSGGGPDEEDPGPAASSSPNLKRARSKSQSVPAKSSSLDGAEHSWLTSPSPPRFVSLDELMSTASTLTNMKLAHEIAIDPNFKIDKEKPTEGSLREKVHGAVHKAFWDKLAEDLAASPALYGHAFSLLVEIKEALLSLLLPHHMKLREEIEENLDIELFRQQCEHDCLNVKNVASYILSVMSRLCAPVRDEQVSQLKTNTDLVQLFRGILELLDAMKLDMANYALSQFRPTIQRNAVDYERQKFQEFLDANPAGLSHTAAWLQRAVRRCRQQQQREEERRPNTDSDSPVKKKAAGLDEPDSPSSSSCSASTSTSRPRGSDVLAAAYFEVLEWSDRTPFPETLLVDQARLYDMRNRCNQLIVVAASLLTAWNSVGSAKLASASDDKDKIKEKLLVLTDDVQRRPREERMKSVAEQLVKEMSVVCNKVHVDWPEKERDCLRKELLSFATKWTSHPVVSLISGRIRQFMCSVIADPSSASPIRLPSGLGVVQSELARLTGQFLRLVTHNRQVFASWYDQLVDQALKDQ